MVLIVVPAYNEEKTIGRVVRGLLQHGYNGIVVVDDGSGDATYNEARAAGALVLHHEINRGQGAALETGDEYARLAGANAIVHFDADGQFNPADIKPALQRMEASRADVVLGSRFLDERSQIPLFKKYLILPVGRWINYVFSGVKLTDAHNGFRIFNRKALAAVHITLDGMAHNTEIVRQSRKAGLRLIEVPVEITYHTYGQGFFGGVKIVGDLIWRLIVGK
ncbi:MAG: hypothetical protein A3I29_04710 [Candidatus Magasanikbacteria bacterium RIFCSPLOWO2_02_FULL_44_11]|uniref:Glycosyltransferase 2-like domain-containing protein n=2 Tax=Candidatus Magasanikiibacteriota TaxID=1752731 RepID=A0A1F6N8S3_9BACT|nr:MAG: hypothetical protein A3D53_00470 [Candidatus Magasanikbacteria bacterium RIFCSPHIGHO2_02_FULL_45_10]OGH80309.1 MAG: hypothetical protein A3I29_04710 [Candidatus Magasanikbacteria bacterium RIFCSPLOWO2_02_FULL_44_11]